MSVTGATSIASSGVGLWLLQRCPRFHCLKRCRGWKEASRKTDCHPDTDNNLPPKAVKNSTGGVIISHGCRFNSLFNALSRPKNRNLGIIFGGLIYCTFTALMCKSFIMNGAGEGNRTLVSMLLFQVIEEQDIVFLKNAISCIFYSHFYSHLYGKRCATKKITVLDGMFYRPRWPAIEAIHQSN